MKKIFVTIAVLAALFSVSSLLASEDLEKAFQKECKGYAMEEGVPADEMAVYIDQCVQDLMAAQGEGEGEGESSEDSGQE
jgi:hypothetical protein